MPISEGNEKGMCLTQVRQTKSENHIHIVPIIGYQQDYRKKAN